MEKKDDFLDPDLGIPGDCCFREVVEHYLVSGQRWQEWLCHNSRKPRWLVSRVHDICPKSKVCNKWRPKKLGQCQPSSKKTEEDLVGRILLWNNDILRLTALELKKIKVEDLGISRSWKMRVRLAEKLTLDDVTQNDINEFIQEYARHKERLRRKR